jgi:peptidyl-prolyl cis-trans isomerase D
MITWLQKTFQQRFRYVFFALLVSALIAFVFVNDISKGLATLGPRTPKRIFYGINLANDQAREKLLDDACANVLLNLGTLPTKNETLFQFSLKRHALIHQANQAGIPVPQDRDILEHIKKLRYFKNETGTFDETRYRNFHDNSKSATGTEMSLDDFMRVIGNDMRINDLENLISGTGYVLPCEVEQVMNHDNTIWTLISATIEFSDRFAVISPSNDQLIRYFEGNRSRYKTSPQVKADYVEFKADRFIDSVVITEDEIRSFYDKNPLRFPKSPAGVAQARSHEASYGFARSSAKAMLLRQRAQSLASTAAGEMSATLFKEKIAPDSEDFTKLLEKNNLSLISLPSFSSDGPPVQFVKNKASMTKEAFAIDAGNPYSNPISTEKGSIILIWRESIPAREAEFAEMRKKVESDYIKKETQNRIAAVGRQIKQQTEAGLEAGLAFHAAISKAAESNGASVRTRNHAPFSLRQRDARQHGNFKSAMIGAAEINALKDLRQGNVSDMLIINNNTWRYIYAQAVKYPDLKTTNHEYIRIAQDLAEKRSKASLDTYVKNLVSSELDKANPVKN